MTADLVRLQLDVTDFDLARFQPYVDECRTSGIRLTTLSELGDTPEHRRALYDLNKECSADIPERGAFFTYDEYHRLRFEVPVREDGDVNARVWIRIREVEQSLSLVEQILEQMPPGAIRTEPLGAREPVEGMAIVEGFRGDVLVWLRLGAGGTVARCHLRDPSWFQWPLLEAAIDGNIVADFPLCNKSFNCAYSGHDL